MKIIIFFLLTLGYQEIFSQNADVPLIIKIDVYAHKFKPNPIVRVSEDALISPDFFELETSDQSIINSFYSYMAYMNSKKKKRKLNKLKHTGNYRIAAVINYADGTNDLIIAGELPVVMYKYNVFHDNEYSFLLLMNSKFDLPDLNNFLKANKIIP
ncbi:MAG: hypothetical protein J0L67_02830 [Cytophagales bacterium]|nr:hypothetical protein [Cytophagales bacterium]